MVGTRVYSNMVEGIEVTLTNSFSGYNIYATLDVDDSTCEICLVEDTRRKDVSRLVKFLKRGFGEYDDGLVYICFNGDTVSAELYDMGVNFDLPLEAVPQFIRVFSKIKKALPRW